MIEIEKENCELKLENLPILNCSKKNKAISVCASPECTT